MKLSLHLESLILILREAKEDADKLESGKRGSNPAGQRVRKKAQIVMRQLHSLRKSVTQIKKANAEKKKLL